MSLLSTLAVLGLYLCWLPRCLEAQDYEVLVSREFYSGNPQDVGPDSNRLRLNCRDLSTTQDHPNYRFWLNDTQQELRVLLTNNGGFTQTGNGLAFIITQALEGTYFCGPNQSSISPGKQLIAYPLPMGLDPVTITTLDGADTVQLHPLVSPGVLIQQYFIDWRNATSSVTLTSIQGPRSQQTVEPNEKYSVDPDSFNLNIHSVRFDDRGPYMGVIGVMDPEGQLFTYERTRDVEITLEVNIRPTFRESLTNNYKPVVDTKSTTLTCTVMGYPKPTFRWKHDSVYTTDSPRATKYSNQETMISEDPFIVESTLTIIDLHSSDSGNVTCVAMVTTNEGRSYTDERTFQLSVLGELDDLRTFVTITEGVILRVDLVKEMAAEVQLFIQYINTENGETRNETTDYYNTQSKRMIFIDENVPYTTFRVQAALKSGSLVGPLRMDPTTHDVNRPTELYDFISRYILPWCGGLLALLIVVTAAVIITCTIVCRKVCLRCCLKANSRATNSAAVVAAGVVNVDIPSPEAVDPEQQGGPPPIPMHSSKWRQLWKKFLLYFSCCETDEERDAMEKIERLLAISQNPQKNGQACVTPL